MKQKTVQFRLGQEEIEIVLINLKIHHKYNHTNNQRDLLCEMPQTTDMIVIKNSPNMAKKVSKATNKKKITSKTIKKME
jgi:hypothetical protein